MGKLYPNGKTFFQPTVIKLAEQTLFKESWIQHSMEDRGKLKQHKVFVTDQEKCKNKIKRMLSGFGNSVWSFDVTLVKQILN